MIDSTAGPVPAWKRRATIALLAVLILVAGFLIYTKDFKASSGSSGRAPAAAVNPAHPAPAPAPTETRTTQPPGPAVSNRNPFS